MSDKNADQIKVLYVELSKVAASQDWEKILKVSKKILGLSVNELKAFHFKVVCLIHLDKFDEALVTLQRNTEFANELLFEKAYCEYRLNQIDEAYSTLKKCDDDTISNKELELLAQVAYKLEKYQESYDAYRRIIKNSDDDFQVERQTNLAAVVALLRATNKSSTKDLDLNTNDESLTYEMCYNSACISISKGEWEEAKSRLDLAEKMCRQSFEEEQDAEDQEIMENEIATIRIQYAFCLQKLGKTDEAFNIYNTIMKNKSVDAASLAVASNNSITKDQNVFDTKKRLKIASAHELDTKLNLMQKRAIAYNEILFSTTSQNNETVQRLLKQYESKFEDKQRLALLKMSHFYKEKRSVDAEKLLKEYINESSTILKFHLIQIMLIQGKTNDAIELFKSLDDFKRYKMGIVSFLKSLNIFKFVFV
jgi:signal recognition particle subunit SRP72